LNAAPEIDIPLAKLELRPSFPIAALLVSPTEDVVSDALIWFVRVVRERPEYVEHHAEPRQLPQVAAP
jgi:hypothetical protein